MYSDNFCGSSGDAKAPSTGLQPQYRISLTLAVTDGSALWTAASARLLAAPGMTLDDVVSVIGPCEDPSISACIAALAKPDSLPGCEFDDFWVDGFGKAPPRLDTAVAETDGRLEGAERSVRRLPARRAVAPALHRMGAGLPRNRLD